MTIYCGCGGGFICAQCESPLRNLKLPEDTEPAVSRDVKQPPAVRQYLAAIARKDIFSAHFERGPRGGAMIDFGDLIVLECFLPYAGEKSDEILPFVPMPLIGDVVHDLKKSDRKLCESGLCSCERPRGWLLTRPILRAMLGVSDAFLNEHSGELPGRLSTWELKVTTMVFMRECYFDPEFKFPTRASSRAARRARHERRGAAVRGEHRRRRTTASRSLQKPPPPGTRKRKE